MAQYSDHLSLWLSGLEGADKYKVLNQILADDCVFYSPVMHTPQKGKQLTFLYLASAFTVLLKEGKVPDTAGFSSKATMPCWSLRQR
jgi:hypothetical protein